jgi:predicted TIM-barrel fold metal-dependent hydrolase
MTYVFDLHTHLQRAMSRSVVGEVRATMLERMATAGIGRAVLMPHDGLYFASPEANDLVADVCADSDGRLVAACTVDPHAPGAAAELDRCAAGEFAALKLHPWLQGFSPLEPEVIDIARRAAGHGLPLLVHDGTPPFASPLQIGELAGRLPEATVVLAHGGLMDLWQDAIAAVNRWPNVMVSVCGTAPAAVFRHVLSSVPVDRVAVGTDAGFGSADLAVHRLAVLRRIVADRPTDEVAAILHANAERWFGI